MLAAEMPVGVGKGKPECYVKEPSTPNAHVPNEVELQQALSLHVGCAPGGPPALEPRGVGAPVPRLVQRALRGADPEPEWETV